MQLMHGIISLLFDSWAYPVVHLLLLKSSKPWLFGILGPIVKHVDPVVDLLEILRWTSLSGLNQGPTWSCCISRQNYRLRRKKWRSWRSLAEAFEVMSRRGRQAVVDDDRWRCLWGRRSRHSVFFRRPRRLGLLGHLVRRSVLAAWTRRYESVLNHFWRSRVLLHVIGQLQLSGKKRTSLNFDHVDHFEIVFKVFALAAICCNFYELGHQEKFGEAKPVSIFNFTSAK